MIGLLFGGLALLTGGCAGGVAYATGPGGGYYEYEYYPDLNVYYYPAGGYYHWYEHGHWKSGRHLPESYAVGQARHERLRYHTKQPWTEHGEHF